jgi:DinB superfamily
MSDVAVLISALATAPGVIVPLVREVPPEILTRRPSPEKWSAYEHAIHLSQSDVAFRARLDLILSEPEPFIRTIENSAEVETGAMLEVDLDESLERYVRERKRLVERLRELSDYSVFIMFRHLLNHEMLHSYRIEELLLKKDWD